MAEPYVVAMEHAEWHAQNILRKHAQNRPLMRIETQHKYKPPQPVLSCRTVNIDLSGTRTYRSKSANDIIEEQHHLISHIYRKARNIYSAPVKRNASTQPSDPLKNLTVYGTHPSTAKGSRPSTAGRQRSPKSYQPRANQVVGSNSVSKPVPSIYLFQEDPDWQDCADAYHGVNQQIQDQWQPENHTLDEGQFVRGKKNNNQLTSLDPKSGNQWVEFGSGQGPSSAGVVDAFTAMKSQDEFYTIDGTTGSHVAKQLTKGDKIRIGRNGVLQSQELKYKQWENDQEKKLQEYDNNTGPIRRVPLCWDDQLKQTNAVLSPRGPGEHKAPKALSETRPVLISEEDLDARQSVHSRKGVKTNEGYKIQVRSKGHVGVNGLDSPSCRITSVTIGKTDDQMDEDLENLTYDDILQMKVKGYARKDVKYNDDESFSHASSTHEEESPKMAIQHTPMEHKFSNKVSSASKPREKSSPSHEQESRTVMIPLSRTRPATSMSHTGYIENHEIDTFMIGRPASSGRQAGHYNRPDSQGSRRTMSAGRPPRGRSNQPKMVSVTGMGLTNKGNQADAEFIKISQQLEVDKSQIIRHNSARPRSVPRTAPSPGPSTRAVIESITEHNKWTYSQDSEPVPAVKPLVSETTVPVNGNDKPIDVNENKSNAPPPSPTDADATFAFEIPTAETDLEHVEVDATSLPSPRGGINAIDNLLKSSSDSKLENSENGNNDSSDNVINEEERSATENNLPVDSEVLDQEEEKQLDNGINSPEYPIETDTDHDVSENNKSEVQESL